VSLLEGLFGSGTAFLYRRARYHVDDNIDNAKAEAYEGMGLTLTPPFEPEDGQGRTWGGQHVRGDLYLTSPGLLSLAKATPLYDFDQIAVPSYDETQPPLMVEQGNPEPFLDTELAL
jgi:hypothetical protein